jgi:hypothetical protein
MSGILKNKFVVGVDFDGTCVTHEYPKIGRDIGAVPVLKELKALIHYKMQLIGFKKTKYHYGELMKIQNKKVGRIVTNNTRISILMMLLWVAL